MNKKILSFLIVPVLIVMSGALAFSAFTGTVTTSVASHSGDMNVNEFAEVSSFYSANTNFTVSGGNNMVSGTITAYFNNTNYGIVNGAKGSTTLATVPESGGQQYVVYYVNITNLAPGDYAIMTFTIENVGPIGVILSQPYVSHVSFTGSDLNLSNITETSLFASGEPSSSPLGDFTGLTSSDGYLAYTNSHASTGPSTSPEPGYGYALPYASSGFGVSLTPVNAFSPGTDATHTADFSLSVGLSSDAGNNYQGSSVTFEVIVPVTSDP